MKQFNATITALSIWASWALLALPAFAQTAAEVAARTQAAIEAGQAPAWMQPELPEAIQQNVQNKGRGLAESLELEEATTDRVAALMAEHYGRVWAWNEAVKAELKAAWGRWDEARSNAGGKEKDELKALTAMTEQIDPILAQFEPAIQALLTTLKSEIGEAKTIEMLDRITRSPGVERTYQAYLAMIPEMTAEERAIILKRLEQARRDSLAAWSGGQIIRIFKKYKIRNEFSIDYFGYNYRQRYKAWASGG